MTGATSGIVDLVLSEMELPSSAGDWKTALRKSAISAHDALRHAWACSLALSPPRMLPARMQVMERMLRRLREAGFSADLTYHAYHALDSHIWGFTLWELGHSITRDDVDDLAATFLRELPADEYPYTAEHVEQHLAGFGRDGKGAFEFVLDLILDGIERVRDTA